MAEIELFMTGNQIGTFSDVSTSGNNNGMKVTLSGVEPLGGENDVFRVVVRQVNEGDQLFSNGQFVDIYTHPDTDPPGDPIFSALNPQHDQFQGRASSGEHQIITSPANIVFDSNGVTSGERQYGPGNDPPRTEQLSFESYSPDPPEFTCFASGALIETEDGPRAVETIRPGDLVRTLDHGLQPVRWAGCRTMPGCGMMAPVEIGAGALGNTRDLVVSPQHRMLVSGWRAEMYFGESQVLVAAVHLVNGRDIRQMARAKVTYVHLAFDRHELILAEGIPSESLHLGAMALSRLGPEARAEITAIFPELESQMSPHRAAARHCLRRWETALVA